MSTALRPSAWVRAAALLALLRLAGAAGCTRAKAGPADDAPASSPATLFEVPASQRAQLSIVTAQKKPVTLPVDVPAQVGFNELKTSRVVPLVSGKVVSVMVHEGDRVKSGQPLLSIASPDSADTAANLSRDVSTLRTKEVILARDKDLYEHKAISLEELQQAELDVTAAKATVANDQAHAAITGGASSQAVLRSPIEGTVVERKISVGEAVQAGSTPCFTITDPAAVWIIAHLYQDDVRLVAVGDAAVIRSPVLSAPIEGKVSYIGSSIDPGTYTIPVRIAASNDGSLKEGMFVDAQIVPAKAVDTIVVPSSAVLRDEDNLPFVYVEATPGAFARRHVELGPQLKDDVAIDGGLQDGEKVLGSGALFVQFADGLRR